jgi:hypothetical protein
MTDYLSVILLINRVYPWKKQRDIISSMIFENKVSYKKIERRVYL